jgi:hypothetical protein
MSGQSLEYCYECDFTTGKAGIADDSLYCGQCGEGPFCEECYERHIFDHKHKDEIATLCVERDKAVLDFAKQCDLVKLYHEENEKLKLIIANGIASVKKWISHHHTCGFQDIRKNKDGKFHCTCNRKIILEALGDQESLDE